jgi:hypothetical protein
MQGGDNRKKVNLTADEITAWAESLGGFTQKEIAEKHNVTERTVANWIAKARSQVGDVEIDDMRTCLYSLFPDALSAIRHCLTINKDGQVALRLLAGLTVLMDKREVEHSDKSGNKTTEELRRGIIETITKSGEESDGDGQRIAV